MTATVLDASPYAPWAERGSVVAGAFRWRLGVRPLDLDDWIELGPDVDGPGGWLDETSRLLREHPGTVRCVPPDAAVLAASAEIADEVVAHLARRWPERSRALDPDVHPLEAAARLVPEDLVVMVPRGGALTLAAGVVCAPNRWDLGSKIGRSMRDVHAPVPHLDDQLGVDVDRFLDRLRPERSFWRLGWGIIDVADGYAPIDGTGPPRPARPALDDLHVRVERETLRRLPRTGAVLFTIRTHVTPLARVLDGDPTSLVAMRAAVAAMDEPVRGYKGLGAAVREALGVA